MDWILGIIILIMLLMILIFAIAKYARKSKIKRICKRIAKSILLGVRGLSDKDREALLER